MQGEITFYERRELDNWKPRPRRDWRTAEMDSPLGVLLTEWNQANRRSIDEYDRRRRAQENYERLRGIHERTEAGTAEEQSDREPVAALLPPRRGLRAPAVAPGS